MIVGGDRLEYEGDPSFPTISLLNKNIFLNSVILDAHIGVRFCAADAKHHYLQSFMKNYQYMRILIKYFTEEISNKYNIIHIAEHGYVYIGIRKSMYIMKEDGILAFE